MNIAVPNTEYWKDRIPPEDRLDLPGILFRKTSLVAAIRIRYNKRRHEHCEKKAARIMDYEKRLLAGGIT